MALIVISVGVISVVLGYSWYELVTSQWERAGGGIDRFRMLLHTIASFDFCVFAVSVLTGFYFSWISRLGTPWAESFVIFCAAVPLAAGGAAALRKGPSRIAFPAACLLLVVCWSFIYWISFLLDAPGV